MLRVVTPPTIEPLTLQEAKAFLQVTHEFEDAEIAQQIKAARQWVERRTWRQLLPATLELSLDRFPRERVVYLPRPRLVSLEGVSYFDSSGEASVLDVDRIEVDVRHEPGRVRIDSAGWPAAADRLGGVRFTYSAGWTLAELPQDLVMAIKLLLSSWYDNRQDTAARVAMDAKTVQAAERLLGPYRVAVPDSLPYLVGTHEALDSEGL